MNIEQSMRCSFNQFIANSPSVIAAYCFFEKRPAIDVWSKTGNWLYFELYHVK